MILVIYHGSGTKIKNASAKLTKDIKNLYKANLGKAINILGMPEEMMREFFGQSYFNENTIVEILLKYATYKKDGNTWAAPMVDIDQIVSFLHVVRDLVNKDLGVINTDDGVTVHKPITRFLNDNGTIAKDAEITSFLQKYKDKNAKIEAELAKAATVPESRNWFNALSDMITEEKKEETMDQMSMQKISNLAVANLLATRKEYVRPEQIQAVIDEEYPDGGIDVTKDEQEGDFYGSEDQPGDEWVAPEDSGIDQARESFTPKYTEIINEKLRSNSQ